MRLLSWSIIGMFLKSPGGAFQMEEERCMSQVPSWAISSICAVVSNYQSPIEVYQSVLPDSLTAHEYPPWGYYPKWHSDVSSQSSSSSTALLSFTLRHFEQTAGALWSSTSLQLCHCSWQALYSYSFISNTKMIFYRAPSWKWLSWSSWHLQIGRSIHSIKRFSEFDPAAVKGYPLLLNLY